MDTSLEYILQCEKAEEIQEIWQNVPQGLWKGHYNRGFDGSFYWEEPLDSTDSGIRCVDYEHDTSEISKQVWLPRQDELQEMLEEKPSPKLFARFLYFLGWDGATFSTHHYPQTNAGTKGFTSMEQLWLVFIMFERYQKSWDGLQWVKGK